MRKRAGVGVVLAILFAVFESTAAPKKPSFRPAPNPCQIIYEVPFVCSYSMNATPFSARVGEAITFEAYSRCPCPMWPGPARFVLFPENVDLGPANWNGYYYFFSASVTIRSLSPGIHSVRLSCASCGNVETLAAAWAIVRADSSVTIAPPTFTAGLPSIVDASVSSTTAIGGGGPGGRASLYEGDRQLGSGYFVSGHARITGSPLPAGPHALTVKFLDDLFYNSSSATIVYDVPTTPTQLLISAPTSIYGRNVTFSVAADPPVSAPFTIYCGRTAVANVDAVNGIATWKTDSLSAGPQSMWVVCARDCTGASEPIVHMVEHAPVTLTATAAAPYTDAGKTTRFKAVAALVQGSMPVQGTVELVEDGLTIASAALDKGGATIDVGPLRSGEHHLTVRYSGDRNCFGATTTVNHTVLEPLVAVDGVAAAEGNTSSNLVMTNIRLTGVGSHAIDVAWSTANRTAVAGRDFDAASGTLTFAPGETAKQIALNIIGNTMPEPEKTFVVVVSGPDNASDAVVRILNDDPFFTRHAGVAYGTLPEQTLDLYVPLIGSGPFPLIVGIEASDFVAPDRECVITTRQAERGYVVATLSFRADEGAPFPAQMQDVKAALRWLRANADRYNIDPNRIGVWGIGAGGHLAALLGTSDESAMQFVSATNAAFSARVQAVVDWFGDIDLAAIDGNPSYTQYLRCAPLDCPDLASAANATTYVTPDDPPLLMMHGAADTVVPAWTTLSLYVALRDAGVDARLHIVDGAGHGGPAWKQPAVLEVVDRFFDEKLK